MPTIRRFEDMGVWQQARDLARIIYAATAQGAFARDFGLRDQMRRAAVSILSNIAEGFESRTQALFIEYLGRAKASAGELRAQLYVALDAQYIEQELFSELYERARSCSRQISGFMAYLEQQPNSRRLREQQIEYDLGHEG
jgi:four helix bundle protein